MESFKPGQLVYRRGKLILILICLSGLFLIGCAEETKRTHSQSYQEPAKRNENAAVKNTNAKEMAGSFEQVSSARKDVREVFIWVKDKISSKNNGLQVVSLDKAFIQVVAGLKYRLYCTYKKDNRRGKLEALVWKRPDGVIELMDLKLNSK